LRFHIDILYADDYANLGIPSNRITFTYGVSINEQWSVPLEYTYTDIDGSGFNHYRFGIAGDFHPIVVDLSYQLTDLDVAAGDDPDLVSADGSVVATATFTF